MWYPHYQANVTAKMARCAKQFDIVPRPHWPYTHWGGFDSFKMGSNIIFSNGLLDPWYPLGLLEAPNPDIVVIKIPAAAHHLDLRGPNPADPPYVIHARSEEEHIIKKWIDDYWNERMKEK